MKLLTKDIIKNLPAINSTGEKEPADIPIIVKFFCPWSQWTWYVLEGERVEDDDGNLTEDYIFFGYVKGVCDELGYFLLSELEEITAPGGLSLKIERDRFFEGTLEDVMSGKKS